jgi:hypothetical protein
VQGEVAKHLNIRNILPPYKIVHRGEQVLQKFSEVVDWMVLKIGEQYIGASAAKPLATIVLSIIARGLAAEAPISLINWILDDSSKNLRVRPTCR